MPYLGTFGLGLSEIVVTFEIRTLEFVKNEFSTHTMNSGIGSAFSKVLASPFSEGLGPAPGPLYKVCHLKNMCI